MPSNTIIKISELETALAKVLPRFKPPVYPPIINGIVVDPGTIKDANAIDVAGKILREMPTLAKTGAKPAAIALPDKRWILGFIGDSAPNR